MLESWELNEGLRHVVFLQVELPDFQIWHRPWNSEFYGGPSWPSNFSAVFRESRFDEFLLIAAKGAPNCPRWEKIKLERSSAHGGSSARGMCGTCRLPHGGLKRFAGHSADNRRNKEPVSEFPASPRTDLSIWGAQ